jgi:hypothetical protein
MEKTINLNINEGQMKEFEKLLDDFNSRMELMKEEEPAHEAEMFRLKTESNLLISQIKDKITQIQHLN